MNNSAEDSRRDRREGGIWLNGLSLTVSRESLYYEKTNRYLDFEAIELSLRLNIRVVPV